MTSNWLLSRRGRWEEMSAEALLKGLESGDFNLSTEVRAGPLAQPKTLRKVIRELVWEAHSDHRQKPAEHSPYHLIADLAPIPTVLSDLGGRITYVNQHFCDFIGYSHDELLGMTVGKISDPDDHHRESERGNQLIVGQLSNFNMEKRYIHKNGELRIGLLSIAILHGEDGAPFGAIAQIVDLTRLKEIQKQLARSKTLSVLGEMAQHVTHDLKNILMVLRGTLDLIQMDDEGLSDEDRELIRDGLVMCGSGQRLINSLLNFRPLEDVKLERYVIQELLDGLRSVLSKATEPYRFDLQYQLKEDDHEILADAILIERLLLNLCVNARQAIDVSEQITHGWVRITIREPSDTERLKYSIDTSVVVFEVSDNGKGISEDSLERILEPYVGTKHQSGGHGLGLSAVCLICDQLNGLLHIESSIGIGSRFCVILPLL